MRESTQTEKTRARKQGQILALICGLLALILFYPVLYGLVRQWIEDPNYRHGLVIPIIILLLARNKVDEIRALKSSGSPAAGWTVLAVSSILLVAGTASSELFTSRLSFVLFLLGAAFLLAGAALVKKLAAEFILMLLMIPLPYIVYYKVTFPLQLISAKFSALALSALRVSVIRKGNILVLPGYTLEVVAACSGLRSLMTMITLAVVIAAFSAYSFKRKSVLVVLSIPVAVAANTFRLVVTALGAYFVGPHFADGTLHQLSGLMVFGSGIVLLLVINWVLRWKR